MQLPGKFPDISIDTYQIMPDHFHAIVNFRKENKKNLINQIPTTFKSGIINNPMELKEKSLGYIIRWYKGKVKYETAKIDSDFKWQSRFYERIIRNDKEYYFIQEYIVNNPANYGKSLDIDSEEKEITNQLKSL